MTRPRARSGCLVVFPARTDTLMRGRNGRDSELLRYKKSMENPIFLRAFKLRYLCDYWELEAEIKTGERFRNSFCICISIRLDLLSWIVNQTGLSQGWRQLFNTDYDWLRHNLWFLSNNTEIKAQINYHRVWLKMLFHISILLLI